MKEDRAYMTGQDGKSEPNRTIRVQFQSRQPQLTLFRIALNKSLTLAPLYFLYLPKLLMNILSIFEHQSRPTTSIAPDSSVMMADSGGSCSMISNRSDASHRNARRLDGVQKNGWVRHSEVSGLGSVYIARGFRASPE